MESDSRAYTAACVGLLKNHLGSQWNSQWNATGFTAGSLAIPDDPLSTLRALGTYFLAHPAHENAPLGITAAATHAQVESLSTARTAANAAKQALVMARSEHTAAQLRLYERLCGLRAELTQLLEPDDPRWYAFGFDRPADGAQPSPVTGLTLAAGGPGIVLANWDDSRRAERYRVLRQIVGVDAQPVPVNSPVHDSELTLTSLPSGRQVIVTVAAANDAGESAAAASGAFPVP